MGQCCSHTAYQALEMTKIESSLNDDGIVNIKIVVFGQSGVGKSAFVRSATGLACTHAPIPTRNVECTHLRWRIRDTEVRLALWDTPGDGQYYETLASANREILTRSVDGVVLVFDSMEKESLDYIFEKFVDINEQYGEQCQHLLVGSRKKSRKGARENEAVSQLGTEGVDYHIVDFHGPGVYDKVQQILAPMLITILENKKSKN